jgi:hypothetical protein
MKPPKDKKEEKDTDYTDELGGGEDDVFTEEEFMKALKKVSKKLDQVKDD